MPKIEMGKQYRTSDGRPVRILCVDYDSIYDNTTVVGLYKIDCGKDAVCTWSAEGKFSWNSNLSTEMDLIEVKPRIKRTFWANVYPDSIGSYHCQTRADADRSATADRVACIKIEIDCEEGEGLPVINQGGSK